jgi:para-nitrobenzyl esterase
VEFAAAAAQPFSALQALVGGLPGGSSEDCLYLNVFAPSRPSSGEGLPVMVWIHGGAFIGGSGSAKWYDGGRFCAEGDVIVVTFNYRLGILGFLQLGDAYPEAANCGLLDQLAALGWVRDNIAAFGGDPNQVTVFGESAGAMSIGLMLTMPGAEGLFHRAILESGATAAYRSVDVAAGVAGDILKAFGGTLEELVAAPVDRLLEVQTALTGGSDIAGYLAFRPVVDGVIIPRPPDEAVAAGGAFDVPVLIGTNRDEITLFFVFDPGIGALSAEEVGAQAAELIGPERWARMEGHYRSLAPGGGPAVLMGAVATDQAFRMPAISMAEGLAAAPDRQAPVWMYRFDWSSPAMGGQLGAAHALEIPFVWDLTDTPGVEMFTGDSPGRHQLARAMHAAWLAFGTTGDPATPLLPEWPSYRAPGRATMIFDIDCRVVEDPNGTERRLWDGGA